MKVQYGANIANHSGPQPCRGVLEGAAEALTDETGAPPLNREIRIGMSTPLSDADYDTY
jgi:RNA-directed DNA polymerase